MFYQSSYKINDFSLNVNSEINRLEAQVNLFWEKELFFYKHYGLSDYMNIAECGCGTGIIGRKLLLTFPNSYITAFDIDPLLVQIAKDNAQSMGVRNYQVFEAQILKTGLPDNCYDFAIARLVLEHLSDPGLALNEIYRILKPEGKVIIVDNDFEYHVRTDPDLPELEALYEAYCHARQLEGGNPKIGRQLPSLLRSSGFRNVDLQILSAHNAIVGDDMFLKSEGSGIPAKLVRDGYLSAEIYTTIAKKWKNLIQYEEHSIFRQLFMCVGQKLLQPSVKGINQNGEINSKQTLSKPSTPDFDYTWMKSKDRETKSDAASSAGDRIKVIWMKVLKRENIQDDENFFEAGGSSLCALEIVDLLENEFSRKITVVELFENPTIAMIAGLIEKKDQSKDDVTLQKRKNERKNKIQVRREMIKRQKGAKDEK